MPNGNEQNETRAVTRADLERGAEHLEMMANKHYKHGLIGKVYQTIYHQVARALREAASN